MRGTSQNLGEGGDSKCGDGSHIPYAATFLLFSLPPDIVLSLS